MKTAQDIKDIIADHEYCASNNHDRNPFDADAYYASKRDAMALAYEHTFGKGYNPEVIDELYHAAYIGKQLALAVNLKGEEIPQLLAGYTNEEAQKKIESILENAKLK